MGKRAWNKEWNKQAGKIEIFTEIYMVVLLMILLSVQLQIQTFLATSTYMEDALAASNLASAVIDIQEYGMTQVVKIKSPDNAFELYCEALKENLSLDDDWESKQKDLIYGQVEILKYEVYNVEKNNVTIYSYGTEGEEVRVIPNGLGSVYTPDGILVESTSVYSKIGFPVKGIFGVKIDARKDKTVDIVSNRENETGGV
ncbi:MAG: hypothetical protein IKV27_07510 [Lachnospiraceae bacterium]|nr:hypothetical protein [Lachnospiraceae bacterium]